MRQLEVDGYLNYRGNLRASVRVGRREVAVMDRAELSSLRALIDTALAIKDTDHIEIEQGEPCEA